MSSDEVMLEISNLAKFYTIYERPEDRLKQMLWRGRKKYFREFWALSDVSFKVSKGETLGLLGRNGAGKSTLLQIVTGTLEASAGTVKRHGRIAALLELGAGFNPEFTGSENVYLAASILGLTEEEIKDRYEDIINFAGIGDFIDQPVKLYSSGMYARLAFAVAAHVDADILIIDEILSVGDAAFTQKCMRFINRFKEHGTILFVTHDIAAATKLCDRAVWLEGGRVKEIGPAKDVCRHYMAGINSANDEQGTFQISSRSGEAEKEEPEEIKPQVVVDPRDELLRNSEYANQIKVFDFDPGAEWSGHKGAEIVDVCVVDQEGTRKTVVYGGEVVTLRVTAKAINEIGMPIIGFYIKDRLGQNLFGDNTFLTLKDQDATIKPGKDMVANFTFQLPYLHAGDFSVTVAIAEGTEADHIQHHWIDDAMFLSVPTSHFSHGLMGVPMLDIKVETNR
ncbi:MULTISPECIES: ABC transporter ATP-binding protein [Stappiaceae]|uniref:ABC transporter ATP-binding protein n=1 Tax=Stappiaceae TaxID=2821832 RepID=UPI0025705CBC|nr:ABC transporter ATP-binding protein [Labrenzia sp. R4_1]